MDAIFSTFLSKQSSENVGGRQRWYVQKAVEFSIEREKKIREKMPKIFFYFILKMPEKMLDTYKTEMEEKGRRFFFLSLSKEKLTRWHQ